MPGRERHEVHLRPIIQGAALDVFLIGYLHFHVYQSAAIEDAGYIEAGELVAVMLRAHFCIGKLKVLYHMAKART